MADCLFALASLLLTWTGGLQGDSSMGFALFMLNDCASIALFDRSLKFCNVLRLISWSILWLACPAPPPQKDDIGVFLRI
jgi:hypothetical protein